MLRLEDMSLRHVQNALAMVERSLVDLYEGFPSFGGEMAQYHAEHEWESEIHCAQGAQESLKAELARRAHAEATREPA